MILVTTTMHSQIYIYIINMSNKGSNNVSQGCSQGEAGVGSVADT